MHVLHACVRITRSSTLQTQAETGKFGGGGAARIG